MIPNIYRNDAVVETVLISAGQSETPLINSTQLTNGSGCGALRRITLPENFPASVNLTFQVVEAEEDTDFSTLKLSDAVNKATVSVLSDGGLETISLPAIVFDSVQFFKMISDSPMSEDVSIKFIFEPIYQGQA